MGVRMGELDQHRPLSVSGYEDLRGLSSPACQQGLEGSDFSFLKLPFSSAMLTHTAVISQQLVTRASCSCPADPDRVPHRPPQPLRVEEGAVCL